MKKVIYVIGALSLLSLGGCADFPVAQSYVVDSQKVYQVEQAARRSSHAVDVIWVNLPKKKSDKQ